ncbi:MAG: LPS export ABC transporter permease LptG [Burkholderiaceae bacterium]|nr:LPS export ABC transporter permease LptG [Burkholderiaceae bacterium]
MSVLQRYFTSQIMKAVFFVLAAFLALFAFFDLVSEISGIGRGKYKVQHAFLYVLMNIPGYTYELMPVAVLIGTIYVLARFASNSEYTIMRVSSLSTSQACLILVKIGAAFLVFTCVVGELITPYTSTRATEFRARKMERDMKVEGRFRSGVWSKDMVRAGGARGDVIGSRFINIRALKADRTLEGIYLYEFDPHRQLSRMVFAKTGHYLGDHTWQLNQVSESVVTPPAKRGGPRFPVGAPRFASRTMDTQALSSDLTPNILSVLSVDAARMSAYDLAVYNRHMEANKQDATGYQIAFWKKIVYPFSVFVMMALALPFAYLHFRAGGISIKIFSGIMIGVLFLLLNSLFSHLGLLNTWPAFFTASLPSFLFLLLAAGALWWVERH